MISQQNLNVNKTIDLFNIVCYNTNVDLSRFNGKRLIKTRVADGIHKPKELIEKAINDKADCRYCAEITFDSFSFNDMSDKN